MSRQSAPVLAAVASVTLVVLTGCSRNAPSAVPSPTAVPAQWPMYNGTYQADRWSALDSINTGNAKTLKVACMISLGETGAFQAGPVIAGGTIYVTSAHNTYAIDDTTCKLKWKSTYVPTGPEPFNTNRGVALDNGTLFRGTQDDHILAIDAATGAVKWNVKIADSNASMFLSAAPIVWNGKVFIGLAGADWGIRGRMMAFDETDGHQLWSFDLIPEGSEAGAQTWGKASTASTGGGSTWTSYSLDPATGELFVPVGNPAPDFSGDYRPGANLYTDSLVVLDANTGALKWYYQTVPHDVHDYDVGAPPALITTKGGRDLVVFGGKNGYLYALDRTTHALVYKVPVTTIRNANAAPTVAGVTVCPGWVGGVEWNGPAYDRPDNELVVGAVDWCSTYQLAEARFVAGKFFLGGAAIPGPWQNAHGWITAVDADTGKVDWKYKTKGPAVAAVAPTQGGVAFTGDLAGNFYAFDSKAGTPLYTYDTGGGVAGGIVAYQESGKEYVVTTSGNVSRSIWPGAAGSMKVYVFSL
ncbi:MAG TPA: PQQ-binding-like beta-propeller repeat protein [Candidatus Eremiobacteraceae bacterium]|nr:PQQ-binding-like beta-propeller repeat protein [Candidatus Eremiobacteraceae bacterium]